MDTHVFRDKHRFSDHGLRLRACRDCVCRLAFDPIGDGSDRRQRGCIGRGVVFSRRARRTARRGESTVGRPPVADRLARLGFEAARGIRLGTQAQRINEDSPSVDARMGSTRLSSSALLCARAMATPAATTATARSRSTFKQVVGSHATQVRAVGVRRETLLL